jgi:hypothetical protein
VCQTDRALLSVNIIHDCAVHYVYCPLIVYYAKAAPQSTHWDGTHGTHALTPSPLLLSLKAGTVSTAALRSHATDRCEFCLRPHAPSPPQVTCGRFDSYWRPLLPNCGTYYTTSLLFSSSVLNLNEIAFKPLPAPLVHNSRASRDPLLILVKREPSCCGSPSAIVGLTWAREDSRWRPMFCLRKWR